MTRSVITYGLILGGTPEPLRSPEKPVQLPADKYRDRLFKYIPGEVVAFYLALTSILPSQGTLPAPVPWVILGVGTIATYAYLRLVLVVKDKIQLRISTLAFVVWAFSLGGPFKDLSWYHPSYGGMLLLIYTFFTAMIKTAPLEPGA